MTPETIFLRDATPADIDAITRLILEEGPNEWNHLPPDEITEHVRGIAAGNVWAVVAEQRSRIIGAVTFLIDRRYARYQPARRGHEPHGYIAEAVVHHEHQGEGLGTLLCREAIERLLAMGMQEIYAMRHADNEPSGKMMRRSGMDDFATFDDPEIRPTGSRKTTVSRIIVEESRSGEPGEVT